MSNVICMIPEGQINEVLWLLEMSMRSRAKGNHKTADSWQEDAYALLREISPNPTHYQE